MLELTHLAFDTSAFNFIRVLFLIVRFYKTLSSKRTKVRGNVSKNRHVRKSGDMDWMDNPFPILSFNFVSFLFLSHLPNFCPDYKLLSRLISSCYVPSNFVPFSLLSHSLFSRSLLTSLLTYFFLCPVHIRFIGVL